MRRGGGGGEGEEGSGEDLLYVPNRGSLVVCYLGEKKKKKKMFASIRKCLSTNLLMYIKRQKKENTKVT